MKTSIVTMAEFTETISVANNFTTCCRNSTIDTDNVIVKFTSILRFARREAGEPPFRLLGQRMVSSPATLTRALSSSRSTLHSWALVEDILGAGLGAGPRTINAVRQAWVAAKEKTKPSGVLVDSRTTSTEPTMEWGSAAPTINHSMVTESVTTRTGTTTGNDNDVCAQCGLVIGDVAVHAEFHKNYVLRAPTLRVLDGDTRRRRTS